MSNSFLTATIMDLHVLYAKLLDFIADKHVDIANKVQH